ncbi:hypothetical protein BH11PAT1_BH11PAT1_1720 [soil metagenome]
MTTFLLVFFTIALLLEGIVTTLPLTLLALIILLLQKRAEWIFLLAFGSGLVLDILTLRPLGQTSIFFLIFLFLMLLYERKYEIQSMPFVMAVSGIGSVAYLLSVHSTMIFWQGVVSALIAGILFIFYRLQRKRYMVKDFT